MFIEIVQDSVDKDVKHLTYFMNLHDKLCLCGSTHSIIDYLRTRSLSDRNLHMPMHMPKQMKMQMQMQMQIACWKLYRGVSGVYRTLGVSMKWKTRGFIL